MPVMLIFILFSGFYANTSVIPAALNWIQWISPIRWMFAALLQIQFSGLVFECNLGPTACVQTGEAYMLRLGVQDDSFARSFGVLVGMIAFLQITAYVVLRIRRINWITPSSGKKDL